MTSDSKTSEELLKEYLLPCVDLQPPSRVTLEEFIEKSDAFPVPFPVHTARAKTLLQNGHDKEDLEDKINSAYPLIHERLLPLLATFVDKKKQYGRKREKDLYSSMKLLELVDRLLKKRPVVFFKASDSYLLRDGSDGCEGFENIGHSHESPKLPIKEYMSYDEIKLSALLCVSSKSAFINDGSRHNRGVPGPAGNFQKDGVIVGMVGARFEREGVMEWQDCAITPEQNTRDKGYGDDPPEKRWLIKEWGLLWNKAPLPLWKDAEGENYLSITSKMKLNRASYKARIKMSLEILLAEASLRAKAAGLLAYVHVVGLGLGVWQVCPQQSEIFVEAWGDALSSMDTTHIGHVDFSWIPASNCHGVEDGNIFPGTNVTLHFSRRALHAPVPDGTLLVVSFAWDGNSLPGNEYWKGMLSASGDPAAACSSQIAELHNSHINPLVTATNLHIASNKGIEHISEYARRVLQA
ncbi:hypothetical protein SK128_001478 [Halocaridina rubra]|uniref:Uncharacterized protein n=1 Tax=Halocaridina rubra TaxID=373956 RepID=A0AAN8XIY7_HALRR